MNSFGKTDHIRRACLIALLFFLAHYTFIKNIVKDSLNIIYVFYLNCDIFSSAPHPCLIASKLQKLPTMKGNKKRILSKSVKLKKGRKTKTIILKSHGPRATNNVQTKENQISSKWKKKKCLMFMHDTKSHSAVSTEESNSNCNVW